MDELCLCPFCGEAWVYYSDMDLHKYKMNCICGCAWDISAWEDTKEQAIEAWNRKWRADNG